MEEKEHTNQGAVIIQEIVALYGSSKMSKMWCKECEMYAFVIDNKLQCCDANIVNDYVEKKGKRYKRESECAGKPGHLSPAIKRSILLAQDYKCAYCQCNLKLETVHFDHFIPFSYTHTTASAGDLVATCATCNCVKGGKVYESVHHVKETIVHRVKKLKKKKKFKQRVLDCIEHKLPEKELP